MLRILDTIETTTDVLQTAPTVVPSLSQFSRPQSHGFRRSANPLQSPAGTGNEKNLIGFETSDIFLKSQKQLQMIEFVGIFKKHFCGWKLTLKVHCKLILQKNNR